MKYIVEFNIVKKNKTFNEKYMFYLNLKCFNDVGIIKN